MQKISQWPITRVMDNIYIKTTPAFDRKVIKLLSTTVEQGKVISGTGGVRKIRWKTGNNDKGKSGGVRILYHYSKDLLVLLITLYGKSNKANISQAERNELKRIVPMLVAKYRGEL